MIVSRINFTQNEKKTLENSENSKANCILCWKYFREFSIYSSSESSSDFYYVKLQVHLRASKTQNIISFNFHGTKVISFLHSLFPCTTKINLVLSVYGRAFRSSFVIIELKKVKYSAMIASNYVWKIQLYELIPKLF